ncbi:Agrin [Exaiptasia diaphana]|nr:Agrin [Exaiptasia diaphana]
MKRIDTCFQFFSGGCFARINSRKKCEGFLYKNISVAQCCSRGGAYYTKRNITDKEIFRNFFFKQPNYQELNPPNSPKFLVVGMDDCKPCRVWKYSLKPVTCKNKKCTLGKVCKKIKNKVRCVCPQRNCSNKSLTVCSNFNITYLSECHMKRRACNYGREEWVMYNGSCQENI